MIAPPAMPTAPALFAGRTAVHSAPNDWAVAQAMRVYAGAGLHLEEDLGAYLRHGFVIARPAMLLLWRPLVLAQPAVWLADHGQADAWYVRLLVGPGSIRAAVAEMPYFLPWCCWHRNLRRPGGPLHVAPTDKIINQLRK